MASLLLPPAADALTYSKRYSFDNVPLFPVIRPSNQKSVSPQIVEGLAFG
ncbi:MAG: hypothetical protein QNJ34_05330 [Xenococcaceae cyanobacterium MO_188.B29]|nr:hypothetical protein [Xenococcaceae cyanobacterium MO_188.B29]